MAYLIGFIVLAIVFRLAVLAVSVRHAKALLADGGAEYGAANTRLLAIVHTVFYLAAAAEGIIRGPRLDAVSEIGLALYLFGCAMLLVVMRLLGPLWTVKLIVARNHTLITHPLFRAVRHPNYFLNILPELIGFALVMHAYYTLVIGLVVYLVPLSRRIREEEAVMGQAFPAYRA